MPNANILVGGSDANRTVTVTPAANQAGTTTITLTVSDGTNTTSDTFVLTVAGIVLSPTSGLTTTEAGGTATSTVVLGTQPGADMTVALSSSDTTEGTVLPSSVTFTAANWNAAQTVTVTGVNDSLDDGDLAYSVVTAAASSSDGNYNTLNASDVSVTNTDNDTSGMSRSPTWMRNCGS